MSGELCNDTSRGLAYTGWLAQELVSTNSYCTVVYVRATFKTNEKENIEYKHHFFPSFCPKTKHPKDIFYWFVSWYKQSDGMGDWFALYLFNYVTVSCFTRSWIDHDIILLTSLFAFYLRGMLALCVPKLWPKSRVGVETPRDSSARWRKNLRFLMRRARVRVQVPLVRVRVRNGAW